MYSSFQNIETPATPAIRIDDTTTGDEGTSCEAYTPGDDLKPTPATHQGLRDSPPGGYTYEGNGLVPIKATYDDLGELLRTYEIQGVDGAFLTDKLLRHILNKDRIEAELRHSSPQLDDQQMHDYINSILEHSEGKKRKGYLRIFAILLLIDRPGDIGDFIKSGFSDHMIPILKRPNPIKLLCERSCFQNWKSSWLDTFLTFQWRVTTPFFGTSTKEKILYLPLQMQKPWQRSRTTEGNTKAETVDMSGAYGTVTRVDIHPTSHAFQNLLTGINLKCAGFAIKTLHTSDEKAKKKFEDEWGMLERFSGHVQPHLVTALGAFNQGDKLSFIFPNADQDLEEYIAITLPPDGQDGTCWVSKQILGLTGALHTIHNPEHLIMDTRRFGRHGDIKLDNILCFQRAGLTAEAETEKILVLSDFGLSAFNRDTSRSGISNNKVPPVPGYRPPELDIKGGKVSRSFDIWTLGCLFLEFITWFLGGIEYVHQFSKERQTVYINGSKNDIFFSFRKSDKDESLVALVKPEVTEWIYKLRQHPGCSEFVHSVLGIIEKEMMVVLSADQLRSPSGKILNSLQRIDNRCRLEAEFTKGKPWDSMQVDKCRDNVAVEAIPNEHTRGFLHDYKVSLPIHTGRTRKSLRAEELERIDEN
ncbi:hypothetical protein ACHAPA_004692 [Fusarium lateritium]